MKFKTNKLMRAIALTGGVTLAAAVLTEPAAAHWHGGCWGCGAFVAGAVAGAAIARPVYVPPVYYGVPAPIYPVCPLGVSPWYCN